jgi:hypothetical protein
MPHTVPTKPTSAVTAKWDTPSETGPTTEELRSPAAAPRSQGG